MVEERNFYILYPVYFDSSKKVSEGRHVNLNLCMNKPLFKELVHALKVLGADFISEEYKRHPKDIFRFGRVKVKKTFPKKKLLAQLKSIISEYRSKAKTPCSTFVSEKPQEFLTTGKGSIIENKLNLVPRKKNKMKKSKK